LSSDTVNEDSNENSASSIHKFNKNENKILIEVEAGEHAWGLPEKIGTSTSAIMRRTSRTTPSYV
jgi:hypothetical protein